MLKSLGIANIREFEFFEHPDPHNIVKAFEQLFSMGVIDEFCNLTPNVGKHLCKFPLDPRLTISLIESGKPEFGCTKDMIIIISLISSGELFQGPKTATQFVRKLRVIGAKEGDHLTSVNIFNIYKNSKSKKKFCLEFKINEKTLQKADSMILQLTKLTRKLGIDPSSSDDDTETLLRCLTKGFFMNAAQRQGDGSYKIVSSGQIVHLHPESILNSVHPDWVIFESIISIESAGK